MVFFMRLPVVKTYTYCNCSPECYVWGLY